MSSERCTSLPTCGKLKFIQSDAVHPDGPGALESKPAKVISPGRLYFRITVIRNPKNLRAKHTPAPHEKKVKLSPPPLAH